MFMICKGAKAELIAFIKELNEKHKTIKFNFQISPRKIERITSKQLYIANLTSILTSTNNFTR